MAQEFFRRKPGRLERPDQLNPHAPQNPLLPANDRTRATLHPPKAPRKGGFRHFRRRPLALGKVGSNGLPETGWDVGVRVQSIISACNSNSSRIRCVNSQPSS